MSEVDLYSAQASMEHFSQLRLKHKEQNSFWSCFLRWKFHNQRNPKLQSRDSRDLRQDGTVIIIINPTRQTKFWVEFIPILQPLQSTVAMDR